MAVGILGSNQGNKTAGTDVVAHTFKSGKKKSAKVDIFNSGDRGSGVSVDSERTWYT